MLPREVELVVGCWNIRLKGTTLKCSGLCTHGCKEHRTQGTYWPSLDMFHIAKVRCG